MRTPPNTHPDAPVTRTDIDFSFNRTILGACVVLMVLICGLVGYLVYSKTPFPVDSAIPHYAKVDSLSGNLVSVGSDTLADVIVYCSRGFRQIYPAVTIQINAKGSATAPPALLAGTSQLAPMSRPMSDEENAAFQSKYGYKPTCYKVALDALAIFVNKNNPIIGMTLQQVDGVFSNTLKRGGPSLETWGSLGLTGDWASKAITLYGRDNVSGTYEYFREHALQSGDYKATVHQEVSEDVVESVSNDESGIGYCGIGWQTSQVRAVPLGETAGKFVEPSYKNALDGSYPLARFLYIYVNQQPGQPMDKLTGEFIKYVLSHEGQEAVVQAGFFPLPAKTDASNGNN